MTDREPIPARFSSSACESNPQRPLRTMPNRRSEGCSVLHFYGRVKKRSLLSESTKAARWPSGEIETCQNLLLSGSEGSPRTLASKSSHCITGLSRHRSTGCGCPAWIRPPRPAMEPSKRGGVPPPGRARPKRQKRARGREILGCQDSWEILRHRRIFSRSVMPSGFQKISHRSPTAR